MASSNPAAAARYTPGNWLGVVRSGTVVLLRPDSGADLVDSLWELLATGPEAHEVLDAVSAASGGSLARLPWFAIVACRGPIQVFLRGEIDLTVDLPSGPAELSGRDVTTWTERRFAGADGFSLTVPGDETAAVSGTVGDQAHHVAQDLPLADGVVLLRGLRLDLTGAAVSPPAVIPPGATTAALAAGPVQPEAGAVDEAATQDEVLAAAEADMAAGLTDYGASAETVLEFPEEDLDSGAPGDSAQDDTAQDDSAPDDSAPSPQQPDTAAEPAPQEDPAQEPAEQEPTSSYDHLWEQTVMRSIEDAAVREDPDAEPAVEPTADSEHRTGPGADPAGSPDTAGGDTPPEAPEPDPAAPAPAAASAPEPPAAPRPPLPSGLIDSVPWNTGGDRPSATASTASPGSPPAPLVSPLAAFVPPAAFIPPPAAQANSPQAPSPQAPSPQMPADADHDGQTIMKGDLAGGQPRPAAAPDAGAAPSTGPMVLARVCPQGHANPSTYSQCGRCGAALPGDGIQVRRPRLGRVRLSTGELIDLDQSLIVGRQPSVSRVQGAVMPKLVQVASPSGDISRSHVEVRLEGWHVMLCDLKATNGTVLIREGQPPRRLAQGEMAILLDGDIADVGDGISLRFEEIP